MTTATNTPNIGAEIPYRRDQIDKPTGSLVFDQHLHEKLTETPGEAASGDTSGDKGKRDK